MKRLNFLLLIFAFILLPINVFAKTKEEAISQLENMAIENNDGSCTWDVKMIDPKVMADNYCNFTTADFYEMFPYSKNLNKEEFDELVNSFTGNCKNETISSVIENVSRGKGHSNWDVFTVDLDFNNFDPENVKLASGYYNENNFEYVEKTCRIEYVNYDEKTLKEARNVVKKFSSNNAIYSLTSFNSIYHYGSIFENDKLDSEKILYKFPEFKKSLLDNPQFSYEIAWQGGGGTPIESGCSGFVFAYKDDIPYAMKSVGFTIDNRLYVDKDAQGTLIERATARLNEFFNNSIDIEFNLNVYDENLEIDGYVGLYTEVKLGNHVTPIFILEVEKQELDKFEARAYHKKYGINVVSNSYDVPVDVILQVEDVSNNIKLERDKYNILGAYDINIVNTNGVYVKKIENGIEVYIPVNGKKVNDKLKVFHVVDNSQIGDIYEGQVVEIDGKLFVKFTTNHFSTYAVADNASGIVNPNTFDNISYAIVFAVISLFGLGFIYKFKSIFN